MDVYKELGDKKKVRELENKYKFLAKNQKLSSFETEGIDISKGIQQYEKVATDYSSQDIIKFLIYGNTIPNYEAVKEHTEKMLIDFPISTLATIQVINDEGHIIKYIDTEEESLNFNIFRHYGIELQIQSKFMLRLLTTAIERKKLNADILIEYLEKHSWYGNIFIKKMNGEQEVKYKWLDFFIPSIKSYFQKLEKCILNKEEVYPLFIQEIDSLTLKFEGLIRDLIEFSNVKDFSILKFRKDNKNRKTVHKKDINTLLWDEKIFEIFLPDDVWFLRYLLIEHVNLRNDVAHCLMYSANQYQISLINQVIIALLRLSIFKVNYT